MSIKKKILFNSLLSLVLLIIMIGFIIINMLTIQSSNQENVKALMNVQRLDSEMKIAAQSLSNFAANPTDGNKQQALSELEIINKQYKEIQSLTIQNEEKKILNTSFDKYSKLNEEATDAFKEEDTAEIKRQSMRIQGITNDLYSLNLLVQSHYDYVQDSMKAKIQFIITSAIIGSIVLVIISLFVLIRMTNSITKPLKRLAKNAEEIAVGNLLVEPIIYKKHDELGLLNDSFNKMTEQLTTLLLSVGNASQKVDSYAQELALESDHLAESSEQIAQSTDELSTGSQNISEDLQNSVELIEQMDKGFGDNVNRAEQSVHHVSAANEAIISGRNAINEQKVLLQNNVQAIHSIEHSTKEFTQYASQIEDMANAVSTIAQQTNLLSLNAAIEAARAGEAGKGFAVVAEEVRKLADESTEATTHIFEMVNLIKGGLSSITTAVSQGAKISDDQSKHMDLTLETFEQIEGKVKSISDALEELVTGVDTSKKFNENVLQNVENISAVVEESAAGSEEISASANEQLNSLGNVVEKITSMRQLTDELNTSLAIFKLEK